MPTRRARVCGGALAAGVVSVAIAAGGCSSVSASPPPPACHSSDASTSGVAIGPLDEPGRATWSNPREADGSPPSDTVGTASYQAKTWSARVTLKGEAREIDFGFVSCASGRPPAGDYTPTGASLASGLHEVDVYVSDSGSSWFSGHATGGTLTITTSAANALLGTFDFTVDLSDGQRHTKQTELVGAFYATCDSDTVGAGSCN